MTASQLGVELLQPRVALTLLKECTMSDTATYTLRLPCSIKAAVEKMAKSEGTSMNQFVAMAVAEKLAVLSMAAYFVERKSRTDLAAFKRILKRKGGETPREGDEKP